MAPSRVAGQFFMSLSFQAFMDESRTNDPNPDMCEFVLGGHIATAETWANFVKDWEDLLRFGTKAKNGCYHFKMREMAMNSERMERVPLFYNVIEKHDLMSISCRMNIGDFDRAQNRALRLGLPWHINVNFGPWANEYFFLWHILIDGFHANREKAEKRIPLDEQVDFIFDEKSEEALLPPWNEYVANRPAEVREFFGAKPLFANDQKFLALQAADLWAWWVRKWYEEDANDVPDKMRNFDFGKWQGKKRPSLAITVNEDAIFEKFQQLMFEALPTATRRDFYGPA